jgi:hypothetical protein
MPPDYDYMHVLKQALIFTAMLGGAITLGYALHAPYGF